MAEFLEVHLAEINKLDRTRLVICSRDTGRVKVASRKAILETSGRILKILEMKA
jgi:hypothetical protein